MDFEPLHKRARADLVVPARRGDPDLFLYEHALRVARTADRLTEAPEIRQHTPDEVAVHAASLYYASGWALRCRRGEVDRMEIMLGTLTEADDEEGAKLMEKSLGDLAPAASLQLAGRAIRAVRDRATPLVEAHVVADAVALQDFGVLVLWPTIRRGLLDGKNVQSILDTWRRKKEYKFWEARLADSFHFRVSREVAQSRLETLERFLTDLQTQHEATDVTALTTGLRCRPGVAS